MLYPSIKAEIQKLDALRGIVTMYWSAFGNMDSHRDVLVRGAYSKSISERGPEGSNRIKFLWQHDPWNPIGRPLRLEEDDHGLLAEVQVSKTSQGKDALVLYEDGVLTEHSVGIDVTRRSDEDSSRITEVKLWEGSVVTWGANPLTPVVDLKSLSEDGAKHRFKTLSDQIERMDAAIKGCAEHLSAETADQMRLSLRWLERELHRLEDQFSADALSSRSSSPAPIAAAPPSGHPAGDAPQEEGDVTAAMAAAFQTLNRHFDKRP